MEISKIKDGKTVHYTTGRKHSGKATVVQGYQTKRGYRVVVHDKARNASVTVHASQISPWPRKAA